MLEKTLELTAAADKCKIPLLGQTIAELVIETLVLPGDGRQVLEPDSRYARMRNVWHLPTVRVLLDWLSEAGFRNTRLVDVTATTIEEQRSTVWMPFESLAEALDPGDPTRTIEGYPSPSRAVVLADAPH